MGKKDKSHKARVAKRNRQQSQEMQSVKQAILQGVQERGFKDIDEALEKAPGMFAQIFPGLSVEAIKKILR